VANPAFRRPNLEVFSRSMVAAAQALAVEWDAAAQANRPVDVGADLARMTLRIAGQTLFSLDLAGEAAEVGQALDLVLHHFGAHAADIFFLSPGVPTPGNVRYQRAVASLDDVVGRIVRERRAAGGSHEDLLGLLMDAQDSETGHRMDDRQLRDEVMTMLLAGHETTATALTWTLALLGQHPGERRRLEAEIDTVLQGRAPGPGDLRQLPVLDRVLRESLRLYPPVPALGRRATEDDVICGVEVKRGSDVYLWPWAAHRHPAIWTEPEAFDPDRWLDPKTPTGQPLPNHAWMPFSLGQRKCIGERFAMMEAALCLAVLVQGRRLVLPSGADLRPELLLTMRPRTRLWMGVQAR
jgi:cytochrome P450